MATLIGAVSVLAYLSPIAVSCRPSRHDFFAAVFFGPSFAMTQALATLSMRSVATSVLLFIQTLIGQGLGPSLAGYISDWLEPAFSGSLRYALVIVGLVNVWAAVHYVWGARSCGIWSCEKRGTISANRKSEVPTQKSGGPLNLEP